LQKIPSSFTSASKADESANSPEIKSMPTGTVPEKKEAIKAKKK
jgi:hypothetical protein